jgi:outer membrane autotransporter protein
MRFESMTSNEQERLTSFICVHTLVLVTLLAIALTSSSGEAQTFNQALTAACSNENDTDGGACRSSTGTASSTGWPTVLTRQTSPIEEKRIQRLVGSLSLWMSGEYERFDKNSTTFEPGYKTDTGRASIGADYAFNDHRFVLGGAFGYAKIKGHFNSGGRLDTDSYGSLLYATIVPAPKSFIDVTAGYARKNYFLSRSTFFPDVPPGTSKGDTNGNEFALDTDGGYDFSFNNITIGPRIGLHYKRTEIDGYRERGATGFNLIFDRQTENSLAGGLGLYGSVAISTTFGVLVPQTTVKYVHEFEDSQRRTKFRVAGGDDQPFSFQNDPPDRNYFQVGAGIAVVLPHNFQPFINYRALLGYKDQSSHILTAGLRVAF